MQDHRDRLRRDRKGIMSLPVKLAVVMMVITITIPVLSNALDNSREDMMNAEMQQEVDRLKNTASLVHYSGNGSSRTVEIDLPAGCEIAVGGEGGDAYSIRSSYNGRVVSTDHFERPVLRIADETVITGRVMLKLTSVETGGVSEIKVDVL